MFVTKVILSKLPELLIFCWHYWKCNLFPNCLGAILDFMKYCHQPFMIFYMTVLFIAWFHVPVSLPGILLLSILGPHSSRIITLFYQPLKSRIFVWDFSEFLGIMNLLVLFKKEKFFVNLHEGIAFHLFGPKPLPEPVLICCQLDNHWETNIIKIEIKLQSFSFQKMHLKLLSAKWQLLCKSLIVLSKLMIYYYFLTFCLNF